MPRRGAVFSAGAHLAGLRLDLRFGLGPGSTLRAPAPGALLEDGGQPILELGTLEHRAVAEIVSRGAIALGALAAKEVGADGKALPRASPSSSVMYSVLFCRVPVSPGADSDLDPYSPPSEDQDNNPDSAEAIFTSGQSRAVVPTSHHVRHSTFSHVRHGCGRMHALTPIRIRSRILFLEAGRGCARDGPATSTARPRPAPPLWWSPRQAGAEPAVRPVGSAVAIKDYVTRSTMMGVFIPLVRSLRPVVSVVVARSNWVDISRSVARSSIWVVSPG